MAGIEDVTGHHGHHYWMQRYAHCANQVPKRDWIPQHLPSYVCPQIAHVVEHHAISILQSFKQKKKSLNHYDTEVIFLSKF